LRAAPTSSSSCSRFATAIIDKPSNESGEPVAAALNDGERLTAKHLPDARPSTAARYLEFTYRAPSSSARSCNTSPERDLMRRSNSYESGGFGLMVPNRASLSWFLSSSSSTSRASSCARSADSSARASIKLRLKYLDLRRSEPRNGFGASRGSGGGASACAIASVMLIP